MNHATLQNCIGPTIRIERFFVSRMQDFFKAIFLAWFEECKIAV